jgi:hypothetical protein
LAVLRAAADDMSNHTKKGGSEVKVVPALIFWTAVRVGGRYVEEVAES